MARSLLALSMLLVAQPVASLGLARRAFAQCALGAAGASLLPKAACASYAMGVAAQEYHSWEATSKEAEIAAYKSIQETLDEKRRFRDEAGSLGRVDAEYTNYRRGAGREEWEKQQQQQKSSSSTTYMNAEDMVLMMGRSGSQAVSRRMTAP